MQIFFSVLSAILAARVIEWIIAASVKTYKENQEKKLIEKVNEFNRTMQ